MKKNRREYNMKKLIFIQLLIAVLLSSCLVGRRYTRPEMDVPENYINSDTTAIATDSLSVVTATDSLSAFAAKDTTLNLQWFELFGDSILNSLISEALDSNTNLRIATLRIQQSRAVYKNAGSYLWPSIGYSGSANIADPADDSFKLLGTAAWELDFWGKIRHSKRAAYAQMLASEEGLRSVKSTLVSDVASLYFLIRDLDNRVEVAKQTVTSRTELLQHGKRTVS